MNKETILILKCSIWRNLQKLKLIIYLTGKYISIGKIKTVKFWDIKFDDYRLIKCCI